MLLLTLNTHTLIYIETHTKNIIRTSILSLFLFEHMLPHSLVGCSLPHSSASVCIISFVIFFNLFYFGIR